MSTVAAPGRASTGPAESTKRREAHRGLLVLIVVFAFVLGGVAGWAFRGSGGDEGVIVIEGELTDRQEAMLRVGEQFHQAFIDGDGDALAALFVPQGVLFDPLHHNELRVDDGSLARQINAGPSPSYEVHEPVLVQGDWVIYVGSWGSELWVHTMLFTPGGEVRIINDTFVV